jgi:acylphosphatase
MGDLTAVATKRGGGGGQVSGVLCRIEGRVQGVGFRAFVRARARALGVSGWVCNLPDGSVAVAFAASDEATGAFSAELQKGPPGAAVAQVRLLGPAEIGAGTPFEILRDAPTDVAERLRARP